MVARKNRPRDIFAGHEDFQQKLDEIGQMLKDEVLRPTDGQKRFQRDWEVIRLHHQRGRLIYESYLNELIPNSLFQDLIKLPQYSSERQLIAKWKKQGYERLCCLGCIATSEKNFGSTCICRVPKEGLKEERQLECVTCGCNGCASCD